jgi:uncharacterized protein involved in propanediol utilization
MARLDASELERFRSELPRWGGNSSSDSADVDASVKELAEWLRAWVRIADRT